jgi:hypothetical protein
MASSAASTAPALDYRPSYIAAAVAALGVFGLYLITLAPSTAMWDTSEYIAAAYTLGIPHPPGNPFFVLLGRVFTILPIAPNIAMRVNLLAAISSAVTAGLWFLIAERVLVGWLRERWQRIVGGALAALIGATAFTVWSQSVVNEKVYTVSLVGLALVAWLVVRWCDEPDAPGAEKLLVLACYLMGLGYANHMAGLLTLPAMGVAVLIRKPAMLLRWKLILACVAAMALGVTPFATQPIRAAHFPAINEGEPTACADAIAVGCTFSAVTYDRFMYNFNRGQYAKPAVTERQAPFVAQLEMWWLYFKWQWLRDPYDQAPGAQGALAALFFVLGLLGAWVHYQRDRLSFAFFGPLMLTLSLVLIYYLNFKYGASQAPELGDSVDREVRDRDYFYLWSFSAWSVWAALGLVYVWESLAALLGTDGEAKTAMPRRQSWLIASPVLLLALVPLFTNWDAASKRGETDTADFARDLLNSVEPYGILVTVGDNDTFPLWYAQEVEGIRRDVLIANTSLMNTEWYVRQMIRRAVEDYDAEAGPAVYRGRQWVKPDGPALSLSYAEADRIPLYQELRTDSRFEQGHINVTLKAPRYLQRADFLVYQLLLDNPDRNVFFSQSAGGYPAELGFGDRIVTHGLTRKLSRDSIVQREGIVPALGVGFVDIETSRALWEEFDGPASIIQKDKWIDRPSVGIPYLYINLGLNLSSALDRTGDGAGAIRVFERARGVAKATRLDEIFDPRALPPGLQQLDADTAVRQTVPLRPPPQ